MGPGLSFMQSELVAAERYTWARTHLADESLILTPPVRFSVEEALEFIDDDAPVVWSEHRVTTNTDSNLVREQSNE